MIIDSSLKLCEFTSVAASAGTSLLGSQIDCGTAGDLEAPKLFLVIVAAQAIATGGSAGTVQFRLASDITAAISTTGSAQLLFSTPSFVTGSTAIPWGTVLFSGPLPKEIGTYQPNRRYLGLLMAVTGAAITTGSITAFISTEDGRWVATATVAN